MEEPPAWAEELAIVCRVELGMAATDELGTRATEDELGMAATEELGIAATEDELGRA